MLQTIRNTSVQVRGVSSIRTSHLWLTIPHYLRNFGGVKCFFGTRKTCPWTISKFDKPYGQSLIMSSINCSEATQSQGRNLSAGIPGGSGAPCHPRTRTSWIFKENSRGSWSEDLQLAPLVDWCQRHRLVFLALTLLFLGGLFFVCLLLMCLYNLFRLICFFLFLSFFLWKTFF
jgi:hypothetical protein